MSTKSSFFRCRACPNIAAPEAVAEEPPVGAQRFGSVGPYWKLPHGWSWKDGAGPLCPNHDGESIPKPTRTIDIDVFVPAKVVPIEAARKYAGPIDYGDTSCLNCGGIRFQRSGSCLLCIDCGTSGGCS